MRAIREMAEVPARRSPIHTSPCERFEPRRGIFRFRGNGGDSTHRLAPYRIYPSAGPRGQTMVIFLTAQDMAPEVGFEPTTNRLTADRSTTELLRIVMSPPSGGIWLRGRDLNPRPSGYEPDELPDCSTPRLEMRIMPRSHVNATS